MVQYSNSLSFHAFAIPVIFLFKLIYDSSPKFAFVFRGNLNDFCTHEHTHSHFVLSCDLITIKRISIIM